MGDSPMIFFFLIAKTRAGRPCHVTQCRMPGNLCHFTGWTTGAVKVGYKAVEVPGAPPTRRKLPRTMPALRTPV